MSIIYDETSVSAGRPPSPNVNATKAWARHYENALMLDFMAKHSATTVIEKRQAEVELRIAERKMAYWERHPNYDAAQAQTLANQLKRNWRA